jgi:hypothetical protein
MAGVWSDEGDERRELLNRIVLVFLTNVPIPTMLPIRRAPAVTDSA